MWKVYLLVTIIVLTALDVVMVLLIILYPHGQTPSRPPNSIYSSKVTITNLLPTPTSPLTTATPVITIKPTPSIKSVNIVTAFVTFYGWNDNDPPGNGIAYPGSRYQQTIHDTAGGVGTYEDPLSFASNEQQFVIGARIYLPYLKKYAIKEDLCPGCGETGMMHVDIWMESNGEYPAELDYCEGKFTREKEMVEVSPPKGRPVNTSPLFNTATGFCQ